MRCRRGDRHRAAVDESRPQTGQGGLEALSDQALGHVSGVVAPLQVPEGQGAVQQGQCGFIIGELFHGVGQALDLEHGAQRAQQWAGDEDLVGGVIGFPQVEVRVGHGQGGFAEQLAAEVFPVGDDAAALVDEVAAQGQVAVQSAGTSGGGRLPSRPSGPVRAER